VEEMAEEYNIRYMYISLKIIQDGSFKNNNALFF
jgi:hypothetical protein